MLTPARRRGVELLDDPRVDAHARHQAQDDIRRSNVWLGGLRAALVELRAVLAPRDNMILLDVGTGLADILAEAARDVRKSGGTLTTIGVDGALSLLATARGSTTGMVCANALALPFRDGSVDVVMCSQLLHHFTDADVERLLRELHRVVATRGHRVRSAPELARGGGLLARFVSAALSPGHAARRRRVGACAGSPPASSVVT